MARSPWDERAVRSTRRRDDNKTGQETGKRANWGLDGGGQRTESPPGHHFCPARTLLRGIRTHRRLSHGGLCPPLPLPFPAQSTRGLSPRPRGSNTSQSFLFTTESGTADPTKTACSQLPNCTTCTASGERTGSRFPDSCYVWPPACF